VRREWKQSAREKHGNKKMSNGMAGTLVIGQSVSWKSMQDEKKSGATIASMMMALDEARHRCLYIQSRAYRTTLW
jgi:hypothetical protein